MSNNSQDNSLDGLWIAGVVIFVFIVTQVWFGEEIAWVYSKLRLAWLHLITLVWEKENLMMAKHMLLTRKVEEMTGEQLSQLSKDLRWFMFPLWAGVVSWFAYKVIKKSPGRRFRRKLTRETLAQEMSVDFPWIIPALQQNLLKESILTGKWAMSRNPLQFARHYNLLNGKSLDEKRADKLFASQVGKLWAGPERLNAQTKAIFGCLVGQVCRDKDTVDKAARELVISIGNNQPPNYTTSHMLAEKYKNDKRVLAICKRHAYQLTVLMALFDEGKKIGIFPPNFFLWLRPRDRKLWYSLNCVRRKTYFAEVAGVYAHFLAEVVAKHPIEVPYTKKATSALEIGLRDMQFDSESDSGEL